MAYEDLDSDENQDVEGGELDPDQVREIELKARSVPFEGGKAIDTDRNANDLQNIIGHDFYENPEASRNQNNNTMVPFNDSEKSANLGKPRTETHGKPSNPVDPNELTVKIALIRHQQAPAR